MKIRNRSTRIHQDTFLFIPLFIFFVLLSPFLSTIPYLDGNIDFVQSFDFYVGGMQRYFQQWGSVHPPVKLLLTDFSYAVFGIHPWSYNLIGILLGITGLIAWYYFCIRLAGIGVARISSLLLATCPLFLATSIFTLRDQMILVFVIVGLYFYQRKQFLLYAITGALLVLTKETGLLFPLGIIIVEVLYGKHLLRMPTKKIAQRLYLFLPIIAFIFWLGYLRINHQKPWSDWLFAPTADKGTFYTILYNSFTFTFLNQYGYQQWLHLFVLNFNWIFWMCALLGIGMFYLGHTKIQIKHFLVLNSQDTKSFIALVFFFLGYFFTVLTIQTYTIPRYILPMLPLMYLLAAYGIGRQRLILRYVFFVCIGIIIISRLFFSIDPLSTALWGRIPAFDQQLYGINNTLSGNDGITYNLQYLMLARQRSHVMTAIQTSQLGPSACAWLVKDPNNDNKTIRILNLNTFSYTKACTSPE